ncbi:nucleoside hydrolase [Salinisphaera hydrothermalis]|uniref:Inosine/uridine-preferring nucleoside hydrolase n=1 Tax=Salinisphaera hydrothermalis (strain C41B8) TaxID=1304275 RepID=A0A084IKD7_SALHC|nr:nucleoside hydrolase [Salinisphaera hydrothermalis]KEZ77171.1 inosine/uridine-preferring nucleoside hydrolase [Salinisphaera hydrothermalis C41B8]
MGRYLSACWLCLALICTAGPAMAAADSGPRLVVIDQDGSGPGGSNMRSMLALIQAPDVKVLGISMVTGNAWMKAETEHTLRMLELIGRRDIPVYEGAVHPLVRSRVRTLAEQRFYGHIAWLGAWGGDGSDPDAYPADPNARQPMPEGRPSISAQHEDAAHFLIDAVHAHPGQVTVFAAGPLTNLALAQRIDPSFARTAKQLVVMGGSISPVSDDAEFTTTPSHEFNVWFDPEAAHIVFTADWRKIIDTPVDISLQSWYSDRMQSAIAKSHSPAAQYLAAYDNERYYMWDEIAALAWLHPDLVKKTRTLYLDADLSHGPSYGNTLAWTKQSKPETAGPAVIVQMKLDRQAFDRAFIDLMRAPTPNASRPAIERSD